MSSFHSKYAAKALKEIEEEERLKEEQRRHAEDELNSVLFYFGLVSSPLVIYLIVSAINYFF